MGQTLTHGVYLPDEGERNCYDGLAANWQLLDGAVGTVAEHTTQIAGKAPAVHTHTKSDITDFPAYGNTAGTICEGNDSRLSDARTPVAHTHTKSDVTDLFNTDNTYSANQNFKNSGWEQGVTPANLTSLYLQFIDKNNSSFGAIGFHQNSDGYTFLNILAGDKYANGAKSTNGSLIRNQFRMGTTSAGITYQSFDGYWGSSLTPLTNNTYDLGSSSYQWNNLYAKNYYYNGTAWGLDQANVWSANNSFYGITICGNQTNIFQSNSSVGEKGDASIFALNIQVQDKNHAGWASSGVANIGMGQDQNGSYISFALETIDSNNTRRNNAMSFLLKPTDNSHDASFFPNRNNTVELGTSNNKWKSLNGINPGALSLPDKPGGSGTVNVNYFDLSGNVTVKDGSTYNSYTALCDGWIVIGSFASEISIEDDTTNLATTAVPKSNGYAQAYLPVRQGDTVRITINQTNTQYQNFKLIPCQGNV